MDKNIKILIAVLVVVLLGYVGWTLYGKTLKEEPKEVEINSVDALSELDKEIQSKEWNVFYPIAEWVEVSEEVLDLSFLENTYTYADGEIDYKTGYIQPVVREVYVKDGILSFDGWIYNQDDEEWVLVEFVVMGDFNSIDDLEVPLDVNSKLLVELDDLDFLNYDEFEIDKIVTTLEKGLQVSLVFYYNYPLNVNHKEICSGFQSEQCVGLFLSYEYNKLEIVDDYPLMLNEGIIYIDMISFDLYEYDK